MIKLVSTQQYNLFIGSSLLLALCNLFSFFGFCIFISKCTLIPWGYYELVFFFFFFSIIHF